MKKCIAFFMVFALLLTFVLVVGAEAENEPVAGENAEGEALAPPVEEVPADEPETDEGWASQVMEWVAENYSGLAVALVALWAAIPKVGGIAMLVRMLAKVVALFTVLKKYIDWNIVTDERIVDGFYFASCMRYLHNLLSDPWQLDTPPESVLRDQD